MSEPRKFTSYELLAGLDVSKHVEKKGNLSYLSWAWAVDQLLRHDVAANWSYGAPVTFVDGTVMVFCEVTAFGTARTMQLPVMDYKNKAIVKPDAFAINTAMMRCLVKAIALHGLGLYIYAGEDLPLADEVPEKRASMKTIVANDLADAPPAERQRLQIVADRLSVLFDQEDYDQVILEVKLATDGDPTQVNILRGLGEKAHWKKLKDYRTEQAKKTAVTKMNNEVA